MEKVNGEVNGPLQFPNTKSNVFPWHKDWIKEMTNSPEEICYLPTLNTNSKREGQQATLVIQYANAVE